MKIKFKKRVKVNLGGIFNLKTKNIPQVEKKEETTKQDSTTVITTTISKNKDKGITIKDAENAKEDKAIPKGTVIPRLQIPRKGYDYVIRKHTIYETAQNRADCNKHIK